MDLKPIREALNAFQGEQTEWAEYNFPDQKDYQPLLGAFEEVGEIARAHLKMEQRIRGPKKIHKVKKMDAVGDAIVYLANYCHQSGFKLGDCLAMAWSEVRVRDWIKFPENGVDK